MLSAPAKIATSRSMPRAIPVGRGLRSQGVALRRKPNFSQAPSGEIPRIARDFLLEFPPVYANAATAQFHPVQDQILGVAPGFQRFMINESKVLRQGGGKGVMFRLDPAGLSVQFEKGKINHPQEIVASLGN